MKRRIGFVVVSIQIDYFAFRVSARGNAEYSWTKTGVNDLGHLAQKIKKHENAQSHINAQLDFKLLGKQDIRQQLDSAYRRNIEQQVVFSS
jgi:aminoglycoside N3'-acetyltransferase